MTESKIYVSIINIIGGIYYMKKIVVGDIHLKKSEPKFSQGKMFLDWLVSQSFNNKENDLVLLGDLCDVNSPPEMLEVFVDYFLNKFKFYKITILQGNHDCNLISSILSVFRPLPNVEIITEPKKETKEGLNFLYLPYYNHEGKNIKSMIDRYSSLHKEEGFDQDFDYGFGHIEDDTSHFSSGFPSTKNLKVKQWMNGHIHTADIQNKGHYLGSPILDSSTESGKIPYIAEIDFEKKTYDLIQVPKFLEYYSVSYPDDIPDIQTPLALFQVVNSLDKEETIKFYTKQAKEKGFVFYPRQILKKKVKQELEDIGAVDYHEKSELEYFEDFANLTKMDKNVVDICKKTMEVVC